MSTTILKVDPEEPDERAIREAARLICQGRLVAFPTETVYGLGANALRAEAVRQIFHAKGRPAHNPVIVHVALPAQVVNVARAWPETAARLAAQFWPGPLTLVLPKRDSVPDEVTAGGSTVAVRCPKHRVALALIQEAGVPVAAPSANRSTELSPTRAEHVLASLDGRVDLILDAGPCPGGLESTVVDLTGPTVRLLRPGLISITALEAIVGWVEPAGPEPGVARSPGLMARHYSPKTRIRLVEAEQLNETAHQLTDRGERVGVVTFFMTEPSRSGAFGDEPVAYHLSGDPCRAAAGLYEALHRLDAMHLNELLVELPPDTPDWAAIRDRLRRAAATDE